MLHNENSDGGYVMFGFEVAGMTEVADMVAFVINI